MDWNKTRNKLVGLVTTVGIIVILIPSVVFAQTSLAIFTVVESLGNNYIEEPAIAPISNSILVSQGKIASNGLNAHVTVGGIAVPTMVADDKTLFVSPIFANSTTQFMYSTTPTPTTSMPIIVGTGGQISTPYSSALNLGTDFEIHINAYLNLAVDGTIVQFGDDGSISTASGNIDGELDDTGGEADFMISGSGMTSGVYDITLIGDGSNYTLAVGSHTDVQAETNGFPVTDASWTWDTNNVMPYINYVKISNPTTELTSSLVNDGTNLYFGGNGDIQKIDPVTMDSIASWTDSDAHNIGALYYYAPYLYAETYTDEGYGEEYATVYQINPTTMVTNESWTSSNVYGSGAMNMVEGAGDLFVSDGGRIYDLNISTMTASSDIYHESFGASGQITDITYLNTFIYDAESGSFGSGSGYCVKINVTTMAAYQEYSSMTDYNAGYINTSDVVTDGTYIYFGYKNSGSGRIRKLNTSMSSVGVYTASSGDNSVTSLVYDSNLNALYVGFAATYGQPATIDVVSPSTMAYDDLSWTGIDATGVSSMTLNGSDLFAGSQDITGVNEIDTSTMATIMDWTPLNAVLQYQPNTIIQGTDLPNLDDGTGATDGVITWGTNPSGLTETIGEVPIVQTIAASNITANSATLNGTLVNLNGTSSASVSFQYGLTTSYGLTVSPLNSILTYAISFSAEIGNLVPNTTYHFIAVASANGIPVEGSDITFTTLNQQQSIPVVTQPYAPTAGNGGTGDPNTIPTLQQPTTWWANGGSMTSLPFYADFDDAATGMNPNNPNVSEGGTTPNGQPHPTTMVLYLMAIMATAMAAGYGVILFTGSSLLALGVITITMGVGASMTIISGWMVFLILIGGGGLWMLAKYI